MSVADAVAAAKNARMTGIAPLEGGHLRLGVWRGWCARQLFGALERFRDGQIGGAMGRRLTLYVDVRVLGTLSQTVDFPSLQSRGVERIVRLDSADSAPTTPLSVYIVHGDGGAALRTAASMIRSSGARAVADVQADVDGLARLQTGHLVLALPRNSARVERVLEEEGVYGQCAVADLSWYAVAVDEDVLSMELRGSFRNLALDGDIGPLQPLARALLDVQRVYGRIGKVQCIGPHSHMVRQILQRLQGERPDWESALEPSRDISRVVLIDRTVDMVTAVCTQLTYEGLLDEVHGIDGGKIRVPESMVANSLTDSQQTPATQASDAASGGSSDGLVRISVNSGDRLFRRIRRLNFSAVHRVLKAKASELAAANEERAQVKATQSTDQLKSFVTRLPQILQDRAELQLHTNLAHALAAHSNAPTFRERLRAEQDCFTGSEHSDVYVRAALMKQDNLRLTARLLSLQSLTRGGIAPKKYDLLRKEFLHAYGFQHLVTLYNLEASGLFVKQPGSGAAGKHSFAEVNRLLKVVVEGVDDACEPVSDIAALYSGYAPISVRLVDALMQGRLRSRELDDLARWLSHAGPVDLSEFDLKRPSSSQTSSGNLPIHDPPQSPVASPPTSRSEVILVVFVGGVTRGELAALSWLSEFRAVKYSVLTTHLITGNDIIQELIEVD